jgi:hypothetical protein
MRIRFLNSALAASFIVGLHTHAPEDVEIGVNFEWAELPGRGVQPVLDIDTDAGDRVIEVGISDEAGEYMVNSVGSLNSWVDQITRAFAVKANTVTVPLATGYDAVISRNGVQAGCKSFTPADMERIAFAAHRRSKGLSFKSFTTSARHNVAAVMGTFGGIQVDRERIVPATDVLKVVEAFNQLKDQPATAQFVPFNLLA